MERKPRFTAILLSVVLLVLQEFEPLVSAQTTTYTSQQLDQLLAPIALYPDSLLSQIMTASTNPQEILDVDNWVNANQGLQGTALTDAAQQQGFDPAFISLVNFPQVLDMMAENIDDYAAIGQAFSTDQGAVTDSIQRLRAQAYAAGALRTNEQQTVVVQQAAQPVYVIQPTNPQVVYVPQYNPTIVYAPPSTGAVVAASLITFGVGIGIGALMASSQPWGWGGWGWNWDRDASTTIMSIGQGGRGLIGLPQCGIGRDRWYGQADRDTAATGTIVRRITYRRGPGLGHPVVRRGARRILRDTDRRSAGRRRIVLRQTGHQRRDLLQRLGLRQIDHREIGPARRELRIKNRNRQHQIVLQRQRLAPLRLIPRLGRLPILRNRFQNQSPALVRPHNQEGRLRSREEVVRKLRISPSQRRSTETATLKASVPAKGGTEAECAVR